MEVSCIPHISKVACEFFAYHARFGLPSIRKDPSMEEARKENGEEQNNWQRGKEQQQKEEDWHWRDDEQGTSEGMKREGFSTPLAEGLAARAV